MSEQQPQPWTQPPADGAQGAQSPVQPTQPGQPAGAPQPQPYTGPAYGAPGPQPHGAPYPWPQQAYPQPYQAPQPGHAYVPHYSQQPYAALPYYQGTVAVDPRRHVRRVAIGVGAAAVIAATLAVGVAFGVGPTKETSALSGGTGSSSSAGQVPGGSSGSSGSDGSSGSGGSSSTNPNGPSALPFGGNGGSSGNGSGFGDGDNDGTFPFPGNGSGSGGSSDGSSQGSGAVAATAAQQKGVVTIDSQLQYQQAESAGAGMILSSDGLVLTNNHVIDGATAIQVTVESTGKTYTATVVGTDPSADVALIQLKNANGLTPITLDKDGGVTTGNSVTAIGNAEGTGNLVAAAGSVTNTNQTMTAQTETGGGAETLNGLIEFQAPVVSGDSGGPVLDSQGEVIGMTTAASNGMGAIDAFAIPIDNALSVVHQIEAGDTSGGITLGYPAFLGVSLASPRAGGFGSSGDGGTTNGATISGAIAGTPAAAAGLTSGDVITAVDGKAIASADDLSAAMRGHKAGDRVTITWVSGTTGSTESTTVTLIAGPAN